MTVQELEKMIGEYGGSIYSFCRKLCFNVDEADELYQDVWLKAMQKIGTIKTGQNVKNYLISLAIGIWRNNKKKFAVRNRIAPQEDRKEGLPVPMEGTSSDALEYMVQEERKKAVLCAVNRLEDLYRVPVLLYYMEEQSLKEIAKELHIPEGTVKRRLWTARKKLSEELEEYRNE